MTETSFVPGPETARAYRDALGCFGTGVTVVTTMTDNGPLAMTVNSFASVSMSPPLILWCPARASLRHDAFVMAPHFALHVMAEDQQDLAVHFSRNGHDFSSTPWQKNAQGQPILPGCLARFDCRKHARHDAGDHSILVGEVLLTTSRPGQGLMFKRGQYGGFLGQG
ncbi:flavin reductase family protein [Rhodobacteraceae bacterium M382]|nr:flavin reductase family protein [Rhodobacteraceae bacterium M382]